MTLINLLNRIHFADGVLEEALHSELEANGKRRPLVVADEDRALDMGAERFFSSFPRLADPIVFSDVPHLPTERAVQAVAQLYRDNDCDVLVAYGSNRVIDLAKAARVAIAHDEPLDALSVEEGGAQRISRNLPPLYAVPGVLGFAAAVSDYTSLQLDDGRHVMMSSRRMTPCITICDPTVTLGATFEDSVFAAAGVMSRAVDSYLSPRYHPPADGLALDALGRIWANIGPALSDDNLPARRELMAAGLNGSFALQKGRCVVQALGQAVSSASKANPDPNAVGGIVISHLVDYYEEQLNGRCAQVKRSLHIENGHRLSEGLRELVASWPIPKSLSDLGVEVSALSKAAKLAASDRAISNSPRSMGQSEIRDVLGRAH